MEQGRQQHTGRLAGVSSGVPAWERERRERDPHTHQKRGEKRGESGDGSRRRTPAGVLGPGNDNDRASQARHIAMTSDLFRPGPFTSHNKTGDQEKERKKGPGAMAGMVSIADLPSIAP